jgi:hypothetical protein
MQAADFCTATHTRAKSRFFLFSGNCGVFSEGSFSRQPSFLHLRPKSEVRKMRCRLGCNRKLQGTNALKQSHDYFNLLSVSVLKDWCRLGTNNAD